MPLTPGDLLSHLVELFDYRVKEVSFVDQGANLLPFLLTKNLKVGNVKKEAFEALLQTKVKNAGRVIEVLKSAEVPEEDHDAVQNVLKVLTALKASKSLTKKTLGDALAAAELADLTGEATDAQQKVKSAFDFIAEKIAIKMTKMLDEKDPAEEDKRNPDGKDKGLVPGEEKDPMGYTDDEEEEEDKELEVEVEVDPEAPDGDESPEDEELTALEAEAVNKNKTGRKVMQLSELPVNAKGELDIVALKRAKVDQGTITLVKSLWNQNKSLTSNVDKLNEKLNAEVELRVDKHFSTEADAFSSLKFEGLKDVLKSFGTACPEDYPKLKSLLQVVSDSLKPAGRRDFESMGGSAGGTSPSNPNEFYNVCKAKAVATFKEDAPVVALQKYWKTEEGRAAYNKYDALVTNR